MTRPLPGWAPIVRAGPPPDVPPSSRSTAIAEGERQRAVVLATEVRVTVPARAYAVDVSSSRARPGSLLDRYA
jgi:hypothetical protein